MKRSGFTLIELLVVIIIMGILAGAMIPMITANRVQAQQAKARAEMDSIKTAAIMMHTDCGTGIWPTGAVGGGLTTGDGIIDDITACLDAGNWDGPYVDIWGTDPWGTTNYRLIDGGGVPVTLTVATFGADNTDNSPEVTGANQDLTLLITPSRAK